MTFAEVSAKNKNAIGPLPQGIHHMLGMNHPGAHHPYNPHIMRILHPGYASQISGGIRAPVAAKCNDLWFKTHRINSLLCSQFISIASLPGHQTAKAA
jgi:hypothetical protein